jgi:hypothetical protein
MGSSDLLPNVRTMPHLIPIRGEDPPDDVVVIIRAGVMSFETLRRTATDSFEDFGAYLISVEAVLDGLSVAQVCRVSPRIGGRYGKVRLSTAGRVRSAGLVLLATFGRPHFDLVLPDLSQRSLQRLADCFDDPIDNPGRGLRGVS